MTGVEKNFLKLTLDKSHFITGERKKKTTVTLKQDEIKKYFPPEYDEQKIRTVICQLLEEWSNQNH